MRSAARRAGQSARGSSVGTALTLAALAATLGSLGCSTRLGAVPGVLGAEAYPPAMVLATGAVGEDCGARVAFVAGHEPALDVAVTRALATVPEATLLVDTTVETRRLSLGVYERTCVRVHGSAAKLVSTVVLPPPPGHEHHGHAAPGHDPGAVTPETGPAPTGDAR